MTKLVNDAKAVTNIHVINQAFSILEAVGETTKRNEKIQLLEEGVDNECLRKILYYTYNEHYTFGVKKLPTYDVVEDENSLLRFHQFFSLLDKLRERDLTGNNAIDTLVDLLSSCNEDEEYWYFKVIQRDLDVGISYKTINSVFGEDFIPTFEVRAAEDFNGEFPDNFVLLFKLDGYRCHAFHGLDGSVKLLSRNGKEYFGYDDVEADVKKLPRGYMYDGELMAKSGEFSGMQRSAQRKAKGKNATLQVFDAIPIEAFFKGLYEKNWYDRRRFLVKHLLHSGLENIRLLKAFGPYDGNVHNIEVSLEKIYKLALKLGYEGLIMVDVDADYECTRNYSWQKLKPFKDFDLEVIGFAEGSGKNEGTLGAFIVDFNGVEVRVGSGLTDYTPEDKPNKFNRDYIWANQNKFLGKLIEVKAQEKTSNKRGTSSLRFPRFQGFRFDKSH